ncbi:hypothetical protein ES708_30610 [subsurface metagenome]
MSFLGFGPVCSTLQTAAEFFPVSPPVLHLPPADSEPAHEVAFLQSFVWLYHVQYQQYLLYSLQYHNKVPLMLT